MLSEYYNPVPVEVNYRGFSDRLFKRDFAGEFMDRFPDVHLLVYGFQYHRDKNFPMDDVTWFLMEKRRHSYLSCFEVRCMANVAIITARGGSKRIPRKNIRNFCGKPIIAYAITAALGSDLFDEVMVSTDNHEIAETAKGYGASVPFMRSPSTSDDYATTTDVLCEVLRTYEEQGKSFDFMCCLYPTAPFVTAEKLRAAHAAFVKSGAEMLEPVVPFSYPPQRSFSVEEGLLTYNYPEHMRTRSQDLPTWYHDAGQFYFYKVKAFRKSVEGNDRQGGYDLRCVPFVMNEMEVQDIDTIMDWQLAEAKYRLSQEV